MSSESQPHWKVGIGFVMVCIFIGTMMAVPNSTTDGQTQTFGFEETVMVEGTDGLHDADAGQQNPDEELTYQELLRKNGDVDGRSKDYFTMDGDTEFGGAEVGMDYSDFRDRLRFAGFVPAQIERPAECAENPDYADCNYRYPETVSCSGTGQAFCYYEWHREDDDFTVATRGGEGGQVVEMKFIR